MTSAPPDPPSASDPDPPSAPSPPDAFWEWSPALTPVTPVRFVNAAGGLIVAVGAGLHTLRPGAQRLRSRALAPELGIVAVAAEPWSPFRMAIAWPRHVGIYAGHRPYEPRIDLELPGPEVDMTHLAWARDDGESTLYMRQRNGEVRRLKMEGVTDVITSPVTAALAADAKGDLALVSILPEDDAAVWVLPDGAKTWDIRPLTSVPVGEDAADWHLYLAVQGSAVAFSMDDCGAEVSWGPNEDGTQPFEIPPGVFQGPIAFQGERVLFAAYNVEGQVNLLRFVRGGGVTRIARFGLDDAGEGTPATVTGLAWDEERRALWAASPELGLLRLTEPKAAKKKPILLS